MKNQLICLCVACVLCACGRNAPNIVLQARQNSLEGVKLAIDAGEDPNACDRSFGRPGMTALRWAAINGNADMLDCLLGAGASIDKQDDEGNTAILKAAGAKQLGAVELLHKRGASLRTVDRDGRGLIFHASSLGAGQDVESAKAILEYLRRQGLDFNPVDDFGRTPLDYAVMKQETNMVEFLSSMGGKKATLLNREADKKSPD